MKKIVFLCFLIMALTGCTIQKEPLVIGHRGAMGYETENTLASIQKALDLGVDMIEIDVFKISSGEIVVFHDEQLDRLSNAKGPIEKYNMEDLQQVVLTGNHRIPTLREVLDLIDNEVPLNIELKGSHTAESVNTIMDRYVAEQGWSKENFVISSFKWDELEKMREYNPSVAIAVLTEDEDPTLAIPTAKKLHAIAVNPWFKTLTKDNVREIQQKGFKVFTYTVNEPTDLQRMTSFGVDGIFTNYPDRAH